MNNGDFSLPVAFHFLVEFHGGGPSISDVAFQEVSGLESGFDVQALVEGGENRFVHQLPKPRANSNLTLKRGLTDNKSGLVNWCQASLENDLAKPIQPKDITISLLDEEADPVASWSVTNAYPVKWAVGGFDAMKNALAIETIELAIASLKRLSVANLRRPVDADLSPLFESDW